LQVVVNLTPEERRPNDFRGTQTVLWREAMARYPMDGANEGIA